MNDSILHATAAHAIDFRFIQGAWRRIQALRSAEADPAEPPAVANWNKREAKPSESTTSSQKVGGAGFIESNLPTAVSPLGNSWPWKGRDASMPV
jgi:hypothetical protein